MFDDEESTVAIKNMARLLHKYGHLCDMWDQKRISIKDYSSRMTQLEWKINSIVHDLQKQNVPVDVIFYRNMDKKRISYFHNGEEVTDMVFVALFM